MRPWRQFARDAYGTTRTGYLLVGEAPGFVSWRKRRRFTGPAGQLIRRALRQVDHPRYRDLEDLFYMTDVVKCHPASSRNPEANRSPRACERGACLGHLVRELRALRPSVVVTFGKAAAEVVTKALLIAADGGGTVASPQLVAFPHPSPRNQVTIRQHYPSMTAFERAIAAAFRKLVRRLEGTREASLVKRTSKERADFNLQTTGHEQRGTQNA